MRLRNVERSSRAYLGGPLNVRSPAPVSVADFLAWSETHEGAYELIDGFIAPRDGEETIDGVNMMSSPTKTHGRLVRRLLDVALSALQGACDVYAGDMTVATATSAYRPDIVVTCDERDIRTDDPKANTISYPKFIVEVLSPATASKDLVAKLNAYVSIPTLEEYLIVDSRTRTAMIYRRSDGKHFVFETLTSDIVIASLSTTLAMDALYRDFVFEDAGSA